MRSSIAPLALRSLAFLSLLPGPAAAQIPSSRGVAPDTWAATDSLGRSLPAAVAVPNHPAAFRNGTVPSPRRRYVGCFYFLWHGRQGQANPLFDNTKILDDPLRPWRGPSAFHWWGEPAAGYFLADDPWVHRKNLQMLADAGVDVIFFDVTNAFTYDDIALTVCRTAESMRAEGSATPQVAFLFHSSPGRTVNSLYRNFYAKGLFKDLWFQWDGKPLILGDREEKTPGDAPRDPGIEKFFTWRDSWAWTAGKDRWQWIDKYPQKPGWHISPTVAEELPVSVAGHPTDSLGRSYHSDETWGKGTEPAVDDHYRVPMSSRGIQFEQQWSRALSVDPQFVFVTGWNEWIAQRFLSDHDGIFAGRPQVKGGTFFVDNFTEEFSRDIMPMKGGYGDAYYLQLVANVRKYKGVHPQPVARGYNTMPAGSAFSQWDKVRASYIDDTGDVAHRDHDGWGDKHYIDNTGRNDIAVAKVACDRKTIYFYVRAKAPLSPASDPNWMQLAIDSDRNAATCWNGYDYVVNAGVVNGAATTVKRLKDGKTWTVKYRAAGSELQIAVPRSILGLTDIHNTAFDFHWADNAVVGSGDIAGWWYAGDHAPNGRFNFQFVNAA